MNAMLKFYAGKMSLEEIMCIVGDVSTRDMAGTAYYGNFYLGLYFSACQDVNLSRAFLDLSDSRTGSTKLTFGTICQDY